MMVFFGEGNTPENRVVTRTRPPGDFQTAVEYKGYTVAASALGSQSLGIYATVTDAELLGITMSIEEGFDTVIAKVP